MIDNFWYQLKIQWGDDGDDDGGGDDDNGGDGEIKKDDDEGNKDESILKNSFRYYAIARPLQYHMVITGGSFPLPALVVNNWCCVIERTRTLYTVPALSIKPLQYHMVIKGGSFPWKFQTRENTTDLSSSLNSLFCSVGS